MIHHAYNGIPTPVRAIHTGGDDGAGAWQTGNRHRAKSALMLPDKGSAFYRDGAPAGHDRLAENLLSGEIDVTLTIASPTVPGATDREGRLVVASRTGDPDGARSWMDADIPVTTLKGVLSSAYEAVTMSRFRIFGDHSHQVTSRRTASEAQTLYPVFLSYSVGNGFRARVMLGLNKPPVKDSWEKQPDEVCAAVIPDSIESGVAFYDDTGREIAYEGGKNPGGDDVDAARRRVEEARRLAPHGARIAVELVKVRFFDQNRAIVKRIKVGDGESKPLFTGKEVDYRDKKGQPRKSRPQPAGRAIGYVVRTTPDNSSGRLIDSKRNEFLFFDSGDDEACYVDVDPGDEENGKVFRSLVEVVHSYITEYRTLWQREQKAGHLPTTSTRTSEDPNNRLVTSVLEECGRDATRKDIARHLRRLASDSPGIPLFATIKGPHNSPRVTSLVPAQVGRRTTELSPLALAHRASMIPARGHKEASPAERVWGFAYDEELGSEDDRGRQAHGLPAYAGHIRIAPLIPRRGRDRLRRNSRGWTLSTLATPKPSTGAPYLRHLSGNPSSEGWTRGAMFNSSQTLIRKVYPTHRRALGGKGLPPSALVGKGNASSTQNTVLQSYLEPGAEFTTTLRFDNLSAEELAVVLWLLTPERLVPEEQRGAAPSGGAQPIGYHRLGHGKPYGLGSVEIRATALRAVKNESLADLYRNLSGCLGITDEAGDRIDDIGTALKALPEEFERTLPVRSFMRSAFGFVDQSGKGEVVRYPAADRQGDKYPSEIVSWFAQREENRVKVDNDGGSLNPRFDIPPLVPPEK